MDKIASDLLEQLVKLNEIHWVEHGIDLVVIAVADMIAAFAIYRLVEKRIKEREDKRADEVEERMQKRSQIQAIINEMETLLREVEDLAKYLERSSEFIPNVRDRLSFILEMSEGIYHPQELASIKEARDKIALEIDRVSGSIEDVYYACGADLFSSLKTNLFSAIGKSKIKMVKT